MLDVELQRETTAPRAARELIRAWLSDKLSEEELHTATLLVSELVTNAVQHGRGKIPLRALLGDGRLLVDVIDKGSVLEPALRRRRVEDLRGGGSGLMIVDAMSTCWVSRRERPTCGLSSNDPDHAASTPGRLQPANRWPRSLEAAAGRRSVSLLTISL